MFFITQYHPSLLPGLWTVLSEAVCDSASYGGVNSRFKGQINEPHSLTASHSL
jgi:hypothetical protein